MELEYPQMLLCPGRPYWNLPMSEGYKWGKDSVERLTRHAEKYGITLMYENLNERESCLATNRFDQFRVVKEIDSPNLKCCVDTVPVAYAGETMEQYYEAFGQIGHVHFSGYGREGYMVPGTGELAALQQENADGDATDVAPADKQGAKTVLERQLESLAAHHYEGDLVLGLWGAGYFKDPDAALRRSVQWVRESSLISM